MTQYESYSIIGFFQVLYFPRFIGFGISLLRWAFVRAFVRAFVTMAKHVKGGS